MGFRLGVGVCTGVSVCAAAPLGILLLQETAIRILTGSRARKWG